MDINDFNENKPKIDKFLDDTPDIGIALYKLIYKKIMVDGFFSFESFIKQSKNKKEIAETISKSNYEVLYIKNDPKNLNELLGTWKENLYFVPSYPDYINTIKDSYDFFEKTYSETISKLKHNKVEGLIEEYKKCSKYFKKDLKEFGLFHKYKLLIDLFYLDESILLKTGLPGFPKLIINMTDNEAYAIISWIFRFFSTRDLRVKFIKEILINKLNSYFDFNFEYKEGVYIIYNSENTEIKIINKVSDLTKEIERFNASNIIGPPNYTNDSMNNEDKGWKRIYFRGHSNCNYKLLPGIYRNTEMMKNEKKLYNLIKIESADYFKSCKTYLDELSIMQHYGIATRLLDITKNYLVALYFACDLSDGPGEVIVFDIPDSIVKSDDDPDVTLISSLVSLDNEYKKKIIKSSVNSNISTEVLNMIVYRSAVKIPAISDFIASNKNVYRKTMNDYLSKVLFVSPPKSTPRIIRQSGAFFLFGLYSKIGFYNLANNLKIKVKDKRIIYIISNNNKAKIREELSRININEAYLFPEIEKISAHIMKSYKTML